ncbi:MAG: HAD family phosphatase [Candidatus Peribacteraceae bacterium]
MNMRAVLFDLDGTLVDTIDLYTEAYITALQLQGGIMDETRFIADVYTNELSLRDVMALLSMDPAHEPRIRETRDTLYIELLSTRTEWLPHAEEILETVGRQCLSGIMTGSHRSYTDAIHTRLRLYDKTATVVTEDDIESRMKPDPYGLLLAAKNVGAPPEECVYVGDQLFDVQAARAAGMHACLVPNATTPARAHEEADIVFDDLRSVLTLL